MWDNQTTNIVQLDVTTGHRSISLRMVEHTKHAMIVELARDVPVLIKVQLMLLLKCYNNLIHFLVLLFLQKIMIA